MAAVDFFLELDSVKGESQDDKFKETIQVESWSWGETNAGTGGYGGGSGAGKVQMQDMHFVTKVDKASPFLFLACATGEHFKKAKLTCRKAGKEQQPFLTITMADILVSSYQMGGSGHSDVVPTAQFSLNFAEFHVEYKPQKADGSLDAAIVKKYHLKQQKVL